MNHVFPSDKNATLRAAAIDGCGTGRALPLTESLIMNTILENSQDTIYAKDLYSKFILNSKAHARQFNLDSPSEMTGKSDFDYFPEEFAQRSFMEEQEIIRTGVPVIGHDEKLEVEPGKYIWFCSSKYPLYDEQGNIIGTWGTSKNITRLKEVQEALAQANEELKNMSRVDELPGLYNRRYFYEVLNEHIKKYEYDLSHNAEDSFCLVALDIDHFKAVNDTHGHIDGDEAIRHIGSLLRENCRFTDTVFRVGGDEFVRGADNRLYHSKRHGRNRVT